MGNTKQVPIESHFAGSYRLEYDGKYVALYGKDKNYPQFQYVKNQVKDYEEMVLIPCVLEARGIEPFIKEVTDTNIVIKF